MDLKTSPPEAFEPLGEIGPGRAREEAESLREAIDYHDHRYYVEADPAISDAVYDRLFARLQQLEKAFPELEDEDSPTRRVGAPPVDALEQARRGARRRGRDPRRGGLRGTPPRAPLSGPLSGGLQLSARLNPGVVPALEGEYRLVVQAKELSRQTGA